MKRDDHQKPHVDRASIRWKLIDHVHALPAFRMQLKDNVTNLTDKIVNSNSSGFLDQ